jgi:RHS repeat-associated protein
MLVAQPTSFVIWRGNTPGLRLGDRVQFWGAQWSRQVQGGDYAAQADFKGWSNAPLPSRLCQPNAHTTGTPRLDASCWTSKPGNSNPPAKLGNYIQVIVSTSIGKSGSTIYGNIAATVVLQVDTSSVYGPDPGHPGYGTVIGVLEDGAGVFGSTAVAALSAQAATATRRISLYSPEMSLMAETELATAARPAILYEYIWFDGRPLAQVDGAGTVSWTFTDHLGTPLLQTSSLQGVVWRAEHEPYGSVYALRSYDRHQPLRFPGQEAELLGTGANGVTERSYNVHRWYRAGWGRYTQADPLGMEAGVNVFLYANTNPLGYVDRHGLRSECCTKSWEDCWGDCISARRLKLWEVIPFSALPKRVLPPFRVPWASQPLTTISSSLGHLLGGRASAVGSAFRTAGRYTSPVATAMTVFEGFYDAATIGYCAAQCSSDSCQAFLPISDVLTFSVRDIYFLF